MEGRRLAPEARTIIDTLLHLEGCTTYGARFVTRSGEAEFYSYGEVLERARSVAGVLQSRGLRGGDRVAIILPTGIRFLDSFLGVQMAGAIPTALYPPFRLGKLDEYFRRTGGMLERVGARFLITDRRTRLLLGPAVRDLASLEEILDVIEPGTGGNWSPVEVEADSPAFLQFSSGTTLEPKAVTVTHSNLLQNLAMMRTSLAEYGEGEAEQGGVCWLPLYHDMGLVGCLYYGLFYPGTVTYLGPETFIARPRLWLQTLSRYRAVVSPAPDFAYGLCLSKIKDQDMEGVDLSSWRIALNGAEPINTDIMRRFTERFSRWGFRAQAMTPVYGLAEGVLAVTFSELDAPPKILEFDRDLLSLEGRGVPGEGRTLPSVGKPMPGLQLEIRGDSGEVLGEGRVGRILIKGPSVTPGYYQDPESTRRSFHDGWLDTGDLGFLDQGELFVSGRLKDLIIIRGRNFSPQEIEELLVDVDGLRTGCTVAVSSTFEGKGEQLILLAERAASTQRAAEDLVAEVRDRILTGLGLTPRVVELLEPGTLPRTSSGKLRRSAALQDYLAGTLVPPRKGALHLPRELARSQAAWGSRWLRKKIRG